MKSIIIIAILQTGFVGMAYIGYIAIHDGHPWYAAGCILLATIRGYRWKDKDDVAMAAAQSKAEQGTEAARGGKPPPQLGH